MERTMGADDKMGELEGGLPDMGEFTFDLLRGLTEPLQGLGVSVHVDAVLSLEDLADIVNHAIGKIVPTKTAVTYARSYLTGTSPNLGEGDLTGSTAGVDDHNRCALLRFHCVS